MGRPKGSTTKRTQTAQQDMQQQAMMEVSKESFNAGVAEMIKESHPILETQITAIRNMERLLKLAPAYIDTYTSEQAHDFIVELNRMNAERLAKAAQKPQTLPQTGKAQGAVSKQTVSQAVASLWTKNTDDFPEDLNSLAKIDARKILGVPFICVGIEEKVGGPDSLNPGKPFWTMQLLFDGTGDEEFSCNVSGGYLANQIKRIAQFVSYEHPLYRTFELVPEYITATDKIQNKQYPPYWLKQWRSVRGEYDVTFAY